MYGVVVIKVKKRIIIYYLLLLLLLLLLSFFILLFYIILYILLLLITNNIIIFFCFVVLCSGVETKTRKQEPCSMFPTSPSMRFPRPAPHSRALISQVFAAMDGVSNDVEENHPLLGDPEPSQRAGYEARSGALHDTRYARRNNIATPDTVHFAFWWR